VRITSDELAELPIAAAWFREDGSMVSATPEWTGPGIDTVQYCLGPLRLIVATDGHSAEVAALCARILDELDMTARSGPEDAELMRRCLRAGLHLVMGRPDLTERPAAEVLACVRVATGEENVEVVVGSTMSSAVRGGDTVALALKQLATNARKHDAATDLTAEESGAGAFRVSWRGSRTPASVRTSRHPNRRARWGLGLVRLAADALGATVIPVRHDENGHSEATFTLLSGAARFTLPLAAVDERGRIERASRAWDEETGLLPGQTVNAELAALVVRAKDDGGSIVSNEGFAARRSTGTTWVTVVPRSTRDQARDLIAGVAHENTLLGNGPKATRVEGCVQALGLVLGASTEMWLRAVFDEQLSAACSAFDAPLPVMLGNSREAPPAPMVGFLASEGCGGELAHRDGAWAFQPERWSPLLSQLAAGSVVKIA
jgi:hypothetical protein